MRYILSFLLASILSLSVSAQQVNPVTDYTFANRMSAGRSTVTDTAAYFSVGPRFNAIRGLMPPMVNDTNSVSGSKRNGLLIFSIQKNRYVYWDSIGLKWSDIAGRNGSAITTGDTAVMLAPYLRGSGTANYLPKFNASRSLTNSKLFETQNSLLLNSATSSLAGSGISSIEMNASGTNYLAFKIGDVTSAVISNNNLGNMSINNYQDGNLDFLTSATVRGTFTADGNFVVNNLAGTGTRLVTASSLGALSTTSSVTSYIDTGVISTRAWRQKGIDSLNANVALKLNISDTSSMLSPYLRKVDTTSMLTAYLRKADTTAMLSPYLKESDTAFLSNRIDLKVNISDTSTMLSPYIIGSGTANYLPKFNASRSVVDSKVYETGTNLLFNTTTPSVSASGYGTIDINGSTASLLAFKKGDTARGYIGHNGATMDINNTQAGDIRFYTSSTLRGRFQTDGTFRLNSLTGTGSRAVVADANGVLSASSAPTDLIDTTYISSRDWRQKGDDSLGAIIATKGSGTVTSVATGYGLSGGTITTTGTLIVDSALVASRLRVGKVVDSLALVKQNVLTNPVTGTGTTNYVPKFTGTSAIGNSLIYDNGTNVGIGTANPQLKFVVSNNGAQGFEMNPNSPFHSGGVDILGYNRSTSTYAPINIDGSYTAFSVSATERARLNSQGEFYVGLNGIPTDAGDYKLQVSGNAYVTGTTVLAATSGNVGVGTASPISDGILDIVSSSNNYTRIRSTDALRAYIYFQNSLTGTTISDGMNIGVNDAGNMFINNRESSDIYIGTANTTRMAITSSGEILLNTVSDAGDYKLQVSGNAYVTGTTVLAATSGNVGVGNTSPSYKLDVNGTLRSVNDAFFATTSGSVVIGGTSSAYKFQINGGNASTMKLNNSGEQYVQLVFERNNTSNSGADILLDGTNATFGIRTLAAYPFTISTSASAGSPTEKIRVHNNGGLKFVGQSAAPTAEAGTVYYDTDDNKLKVYNGTTWVDLH